MTAFNTIKTVHSFTLSSSKTVWQDSALQMRRRLSNSRRRWMSVRAMHTRTQGVDHSRTVSVSRQASASNHSNLQVARVDLVSVSSLVDTVVLFLKLQHKASYLLEVSSCILQLLMHPSNSRPLMVSILAIQLCKLCYRT